MHLIGGYRKGLFYFSVVLFQPFSAALFALFSVLLSLGCQQAKFNAFTFRFPVHCLMSVFFCSPTLSLSLCLSLTRLYTYSCTHARTRACACTHTNKHSKLRSQCGKEITRENLKARPSFHLVYLMYNAIILFC